MLIMSSLFGKYIAQHFFVFSIVNQDKFCTNNSYLTFNHPNNIIECERNWDTLSTNNNNNNNNSIEHKLVR